MATRLSYALPIAQQLALSTARRLRPGGLAAALSAEGRPFVIVTGAGRSGTSAVARVLHESGVRMGAQFDDPSDDNATGFYEDVGMRNLNQRILGDAGLEKMRRVPTWPWRSALLAVAARYTGEMRALAREALDGWKDPLFAVTLEAWLPHLPRRPKIVLCLRSPEAYLHSATRIYGLTSREMIERRWAADFRRLLAVVRDYRLEATCVEYDALVREPKATVARLASFVEHELDARYVEPGLRRFDYTVPARHAALYERVRALGGATNGARDSGDVAAYLERTAAIEARAAQAMRDWAGAPPAAQSLASDAGRNAAEACNAALRESQVELGTLAPPAGLERYHELARAYVNEQRLAAELACQAASGARPLEEALRAWRRFASPEAVAKPAAARARERVRALRRLGVPAAR
jgi:hypothetical protein